MIAKWLFSTGGRGGAVALLWLGNAALAWSLAAITVPVAVQPLAERPEGVWALYREGGRLAMDLVGMNGAAMQTALGAYLAATLAVLAMGIALGGFVPKMGASEIAPTVHEALSYAVKKMPTVLALAAIAGAGYAVAGALGWYSVTWAMRTGEAIADISRRDLRTVAAVIPAVVIAGVVAVWHDVAKAVAMREGRPALVAALDALGAMGRSPLRTVGQWGLWGALGLLGPLVAWGVGQRLGWRASVEAAIALTVVQQLALGWRMHCRMKCFVALGRGLARR